MNTINVIKELCKKKGISISTLEKDLGYGNGSLAKARVIPSDRVYDIAKYFNVSMEYLMGEDKTIGLNRRDHRDIKKSVDEIMTSLDNHDGETLYYDGVEVNLSDETKALLRNALTLAMQAVKMENKEKYNPHKNGK